MTVLEHVYPFNINSGTDANARNHTGTITWTRDDTTQVVSMRVQWVRTGVGTGAIYVNFPAGTVPAEMAPEIDQYPYVDGVSFEIRASDLGGYTYISGATGDAEYRYTTDAPIVEPEPEPDPVPTMSSVELKINRDNTTAFIAVKPSSVVLIPQEKVEQPSGGYKLVDGEPRRQQTFRIIELGMHQTPPIITLTDGKQRAVDFWLLGEWDADMAVDDHWMAEDGREWLVGDIVRSNHYETRGLVVERGK